MFLDGVETVTVTAVVSSKFVLQEQAVGGVAGFVSFTQGCHSVMCRMMNKHSFVQDHCCVLTSRSKDRA
jgi:hypothetical protein